MPERPARAALFALAKLATRMGGAASNLPLMRLVRELLFVALMIAVMAIIAIVTIAHAMVVSAIVALRDHRDRHLPRSSPS